MGCNDIWLRLKRLHGRLNGCTVVYDLEEYQSCVNEIRAAEAGLRSASDEELGRLSRDLRRRAGAGVDDLLVEAFALVAEAGRRVIRIDAFDEQLIGGIVLHRGKIAEMQTGEGKTLAAVFAAYLNALEGKGVHVITFNEYLARRDAQWMGPVYEFLGVTVGCVQERMDIAERKTAYCADITYVTAKEAGFDFLRDGLCYDASNIVQRGFHYAIVDEADSILIDEARVPLVIAGAKETEQDCGERADGSLAELARELRRGADFETGDYGRDIFLTEQGAERVEATLRRGNLYDTRNGPLLTKLHHALRAEHLLRVDKDYIVRNGTVEIVDEFTGRVAQGRRWPDGLHAAVEAKEACVAQSKGVILNSIALQYFLRRYQKLSGMTATARAAEEEFRVFYNLHVAVIPPHKRCVRVDEPDMIYRTRKEKDEALTAEILRVHAAGRPILVGTQSVAESDRLAESLWRRGVACDVLNAKCDEFEASIIARAGKPGAIVISTNMAGRGTDIKLGGADESEKPRATALGGLYVIGANRHESARVDNQLRGRAGRQGDPGSSRFFTGLDDDLCVQYRLRELIPERFFSSSREGPVGSPVIRAELARLQRIIEGRHLEMKKTLWNYSCLIERQRAVVAQKRNDILCGAGALAFYKKHSAAHFERLLALLGEETLLRACRTISLACLDAAWSRYLAEMSAIQEGIHLRVYGKQNPLFEYNKLAMELLDEALDGFETNAFDAFDRIAVENGRARLPAGAARAPAATWTYLITDRALEDTLSAQLMGDFGFSLWAGLLWPLTVAHFVMKKIKRKGGV